jgi:hypothetical protein
MVAPVFDAADRKRSQPFSQRREYGHFVRSSSPRSTAASSHKYPAVCMSFRDSAAFASQSAALRIASLSGLLIDNWGHR